VDAFGPVNRLPRAGGCLAGRGKQAERPRATDNRPGGVRALRAAHDRPSGKRLGRFDAGKSWEPLLDLLVWRRGRYPKEETRHVVRDDDGPHKKAELRAGARQKQVKCSLTASNASWRKRLESPFTERQANAWNNADDRRHEALPEASE